MSLKVEGTGCVRCRSYLFSEDDVVYCPICGAPHHRECYNALGHCALEDFHGTENQYSPKIIEEKNRELEEKQAETNPNTVKCEMCGEVYEQNLRRCPKCGAPDIKHISGFGQFDFLGGVPADYDLGDGVTAEDAKKFVAANTHRYIPKFAVLNKKNKFSWNWMAFLFPTGWMLSRKMYKGGIVTALLTIAATCLSYPLTLKLYNLGFSQVNIQQISQIAESLPEIGLAALLLAVLSTFFDLGIRVVSALLGDYIYKNHSLSLIKKIKAESEDIVTDYRKKGGMSMLLFFLGILLVQYGSVIMTIFL